MRQCNTQIAGRNINTGVCSTLDNRSSASEFQSGDDDGLTSRDEAGDQFTSLRQGSVGFDQVLLESDGQSGSDYIASVISDMVIVNRADLPVSFAREMERAFGGLSVHPWALAPTSQP